MTHETASNDTPEFDDLEERDALTDMDEEAADARLGAMGAFASVIRQTPWFTKIGQPFKPADVALIERCANATGFEAYAADIRDWEEAAEAAASGDINSPWWEAEESLRAAVTQDALDYLGEEELTIALTHIQAVAAEVIPNRIWDVATMWGMTEEDMVDAAVGQALHACHNAALLVATGATDEDAEEHPFSLKFKLFEQGRWPIGVYGSTFMVF